jgi:hypothetical protein
MAGSCENRNEHLVSINSGKFIEQLIFKGEKLFSHCFIISKLASF